MWRQKSDDANWLPLADMMTALMIIFMFIALNFILQIIEHTFIEEEIYNKLETVFENELENQEIELGPDGSIRFNLETSEELFEDADDTPTPYFKSLLSEFLPKYWELIESDPTYLNYIKEIRIEGHADPRSLFYKSDTAKTPEVSFMNNLELSQNRARNVLKFLREQPFYTQADSLKKEHMNFLFTSIGFSSSRSLNSAGNYVYVDSNKTIDNAMSRRVEFRIVTSNEELTKKLAEENEH